MGGASVTSRRKGVLAATVGALVAAILLVFAGPAAADSVTNIGSFADPRTDMPNRPGQLVRALYGPYEVCAKGTSVGNCVDGQIHNAVNASAPAPCTNCRITDIVPNLVY